MAKWHFFIGKFDQVIMVFLMTAKCCQRLYVTLVLFLKGFCLQNLYEDTEAKGS